MKKSDKNALTISALREYLFGLLVDCVDVDSSDQVLQFSHVPGGCVYKVKLAEDGVFIVSEVSGTTAHSLGTCKSNAEVLATIQSFETDYGGGKNSLILVIKDRLEQAFGACTGSIANNSIIAVGYLMVFLIGRRYRVSLSHDVFIRVIPGGDDSISYALPRIPVEEHDLADRVIEYIVKDAEVDFPGFGTLLSRLRDMTVLPVVSMHDRSLSFKYGDIDYRVEFVSGNYRFSASVGGFESHVEVVDDIDRLFNSISGAWVVGVCQERATDSLSHPGDMYPDYYACLRALIGDPVGSGVLSEFGIDYERFELDGAINALIERLRIEIGATSVVRDVLQREAKASGLFICEDRLHESLINVLDFYKKEAVRSSQARMRMEDDMLACFRALTYLVEGIGMTDTHREKGVMVRMAIKVLNGMIDRMQDVKNRGDYPPGMFSSFGISDYAYRDVLSENRRLRDELARMKGENVATSNDLDHPF